MKDLLDTARTDKTGSSLSNWEKAAWLREMTELKKYKIVIK